jgi:hypothetical protein
MRTLRRVLLGLLAVGALNAQFLSAPTASADTAAQDNVRIVPSQRVYGETRGELMTELWTYEYQRHVGDAVPECLSFGKEDKVLVGAPDSTCIIRHGRPIMVFWSATCDTGSPPPWYAETEADQLRCARELLTQDNEFVKVSVDGVATTISTPAFDVISRQFSYVAPVDNQFGYVPGPGTASAVSWVAMVYLPEGHHVLGLQVKYAYGDGFTITKTVDVVH